jgi:hypothetical protein
LGARGNVAPFFFVCSPGIQFTNGGEPGVKLRKQR